VTTVKPHRLEVGTRWLTHPHPHTHPQNHTRIALPRAVSCMEPRWRHSGGDSEDEEEVESACVDFLLLHVKQQYSRSPAFVKPRNLRGQD
jgi:hypothetical protein